MIANYPVAGQGFRKDTDYLHRAWTRKMGEYADLHVRMSYWKDFTQDSCLFNESVQALPTVEQWCQDTLTPLRD